MTSFPAFSCLLSRLRLNFCAKAMRCCLTLLVMAICAPNTGCSTLALGRTQVPPFQFDRSSNDTVRVTVILPKDSRYLSSIQRIGPAISIGVSKTKSILPGWHWDVRYRDSQCNPAYGQMYAVRAYVEERVHLFLGPACDYVTASVARLLKFWDVPLITAGALARDYGLPKSSFESEFFLLTRIGLSFNGMASCLLAVCSHFGWRRLLLVYDSKARPEIAKEDYCMLWTKALVAELRERGNYTWQPYKLPSTLTKDVITDFLKNEVGAEYGVVILCANADTVRSMLITAEQLGMVSSGEHIFLSLELFTRRKYLKKPWFRASSSPSENSLAQKAFAGLLQMTGYHEPSNPDFPDFVRQVREKADTEFNYDYGDDEEVNIFATGFHDAVILYASALNKSLSEGFTVTNGSVITQKMWNRSFEGIASEVTIDNNGDRMANYSIFGMDHETKEFQVVLTYDGVRRSLLESKENQIQWPGGRDAPPLDTPVCGYDRSKCPEDTEIPQYAVLSAVLAGVVVVLTIASFFIFRHYKLEAELASMTWKIRWEEISSAAGIRKRLGSRMSLARISLQSACSLETVQGVDFSKQMFVHTGYFKGSMVAIKPVHKNRIEITRSLLLEMKRMKDLQHDHVVRFIGACVEPPHTCLITEYCPKGSLQDILENDEIKLDWMFRYSLMHDLVKGMCFLHSSEIRSHGNLKSSNCVVDSRFVLKITDFGFHSLRTYVDVDNDDSYAHWRRKLWTSPELLRSPNPPPDGTQKGDVYSFAIIAHEIVVRQGCFYLGPFEMSPKEIIENVKEGRVPLFRPLLADGTCEEEVTQMIRKCWAENPTDRPDFHSIKSTIRKINGGNRSCNILDNLLSRMEQYATNLESLVEERTADYLEEKRKAEDLLYQLLPKSVASQLIRGQSVTAEAYDGVSIYFSDIVGFTSLSAQSTPMQIVTFLNDLYVCFDSIIENFDVYKVETIGDAYMVASGLPVRNGNLHAREIARMSIALLDAVLNFSIRHRPSEQLKLRIGIHSGPCAAGVVGLRMPRYCLFGDTVNTASRMESTGEPLKIHVSPKTKELLDTFGGFLLEKRGEVELKGKGTMTTYWLKGEQYTPASNCRSSESFVKETKI